MHNKIILVDVDGVLLDWLHPFENWMKEHGKHLIHPDKYGISNRYSNLKEDGLWYAKVFNESAYIRKMPPLRDAIKYIKKLHEEYGFIFHAISAISNNVYSQELRTENLKELFGPTVFEKFIYLNTAELKTKVLKQYKDTECYWIEDNIKNAEIGYNLGLKSLLLNHPYNSDFNHPEIERVDNWKHIYDIITGED